MHSAQFRLVAQSCPTLCNPMNRSMPGLPVHHQLPESTRSPSNRCCHPTISSSVVPFSFCPQSFPASGSFQMSQLFTSGGQRIGVSASKSVLPMNTQDWSLRNYAAAAKSFQLCLTLCDPRDCSPPGSPVPGILQARTLEWVAISFSNAWTWKVKVKSLSRVRL